MNLTIADPSDWKGNLQQFTKNVMGWNAYRKEFIASMTTKFKTWKDVQANREMIVDVIMCTLITNPDEQTLFRVVMDHKGDKLAHDLVKNSRKWAKKYDDSIARVFKSLGQAYADLVEIPRELKECKKPSDEDVAKVLALHPGHNLSPLEKAQKKALDSSMVELPTPVKLVPDDDDDESDEDYVEADEGEKAEEAEEGEKAEEAEEGEEAEEAEEGEEADNGDGEPDEGDDCDEEGEDEPMSELDEDSDDDDDCIKALEAQVKKSRKLFELKGREYSIAEELTNYKFADSLTQSDVVVVSIPSIGERGKFFKELVGANRQFWLLLPVEFMCRKEFRFAVANGFTYYITPLPPVARLVIGGELFKFENMMWLKGSHKTKPDAPVVVFNADTETLSVAQDNK